MVQHEICHHIILVRQAVDIVPGTERRVHDIIVDHGKAAVAGRGIEREDMKSSDNPSEMSGENLVKFL